MNETTEAPISNLHAIKNLSAQDLQIATFLLLAELAKRLTGEIPCLLLDSGYDIPTLVHAPDRRVVWLPPRSCEGELRKSGSPPVPLQTQPPTDQTTGRTL
jgi:hypothetical protein